MLLPTVPKLKRDKAVLESNVDYEDEEEIEVGFTTTIQPIKSVKRTKSSSKNRMVYQLVKYKLLKHYLLAFLMTKT